MSVKIVTVYWSHYNSGTNKTEVRCLIEADTVSDLPGMDDITGYRLTIGCVANIIDTAAVYKINSAGNWYIQQQGTDFYTRSQIDTMLAAKQDLLTFDPVPTANSDNPVKSKGIKTYVDTAVSGEADARKAECNVLANAGAKNLCPYNTASVAVPNRAAIDDQPINLTAGTYIMSFTQTATTGSSSIKFSYNGTAVLSFPISNDSVPEKEVEFTLSSAANQIKVFSNAINDYSNIMIRRKEITDATYQPYAPTNRELYEMILAL